MGPVLDIVALRSLLAIADHGGFHRAARALSLSQSAVSQHVRRLEKTLGRPVVERDGRRTRFTPDGEALIEEARRIVGVHDAAVRRLRGTDPAETTVTIGSTEHAADQILPALADAVRAVRPQAQVRFRIDRSARLVEAVDRGTVDVAVYVAEAAATPGVPAGALPLAWYTIPGWAPPTPPEPLPLVAVQEPCTIRHRALSVLSDHGIPAAVVCDAGYLAGVLDATRAGLGAALLAAVGPHPDGLERRDDLPT
ncbi:LysR family transcriptional regulator, partial [Streptomyces hainanensis]